MSWAFWLASRLSQGLAQQGRIVGLNHVAISVSDYKGATDFYGKQMGFREAFAFREPDGSPYLTYFQINRDTFVEVMQATPQRPAGCPHFGLEVEHLDSAVEQLSQRGVEVSAPSLSPRTGSRIAVASGPGASIWSSSSSAPRRFIAKSSTPGSEGRIPRGGEKVNSESWLVDGRASPSKIKSPRPKNVRRRRGSSHA